MSKPSKPIYKFIYVHGTNGSGKSTLARAVIAASGGTTGINYILPNKKATYTHTASGLVLVGKYGTACGGVDGLSPYASIFSVVGTNAAMGRNVFAEGLITPGVETCSTLAAAFEQHLFIHLDTPIEQCIQNVLARRGRKGTIKEYDPSNLLKKSQSARNWASRLDKAGLHTASLTWDNAYSKILQELGLPHPSTKDLL